MNKAPAPGTAPIHPHAAALAFEIELDGQAGVGVSAPTRLRVIPDGEFDAVDGRPGNIKGVKAKKWVMHAKAAQAVISRFLARRLKLVIDYEHQTLKAADNGKPAPAAGWITALEYEPGKGLMATVEWTEDGRAFVEGREYLYLSPVFLFHPDTGEVQSLHSVALTNTPALNSLGEIAAMAALAALADQNDFYRAEHSPLTGRETSLRSFSRRLPGSGRTTNEEPTMDKTKVLVALGLPLDTGDETALTALSALSQKAGSLEAEVAALKANQFDPAKHIPLDEHKKVTTELAALKESQDKAAHDQLITAALSDARILPANEAYWRKQPLAALQEFLKDAKPLAALSSTQTGGKPPAGGAAVALSAEEQAACAALGMTPEAFAKAKA